MCARRFPTQTGDGLPLLTVRRGKTPTQLRLLYAEGVSQGSLAFLDTFQRAFPGRSAAFHAMTAVRKEDPQAQMRAVSLCRALLRSAFVYHFSLP